MSTLFFSRDGKDPHRSNPGYKLSIEIITQFFNSYKAYYFKNLPVINPDSVSSPLSEYTHVVIEVLSNETNKKFPQPGFYLFPSLSPKDCEKLINIP